MGIFPTILALAAQPALGGTVGQIQLIACGPVPQEVLLYLQEGLAREFQGQVIPGQEIPVPRAAYDQGRRQYRAEAFLPELPPGRKGDLVLGVTAADLYVPSLNFVFGVADPRGKQAIISLARLAPEFFGQPANSSLLQERALKEAVHELGHLLGLGHCPRSGCIMFFSNTLADTDRKGPGFCPDCRRRLDY